MTRRERILAIAVSGLLLAFVVSWGFGKYRTALQQRHSALLSAQDEQARIHEQLMRGEYANRYMGEYLVRSLPPDPEQAKSTYTQWLLELVNSSQLSGATVSANSSRSIRGLYHRLEFRVQGRSDMPHFISLLHSFYATDYLHRIRDFSLTPTKAGDFKVEMSIDAIALMAAPDDLPPRSAPAWQIDGDVASYREEIMNRNFFQPPNQPPQYRGPPTVETVIGQPTPTPLTFNDPEGQAIRYEFAKPPPEFVTLDSATGTVQIDSDKRQEFEIAVRAIDSGYPRRSTDQVLTVKVVDPPPEPPAPAPRPEFDDASQTVLTGLVLGRDQEQGRDEWTAWLNVRTRGQTIKLQRGDKFEIGSLQGTVVEVTARYVALEIQDRVIKLGPSGTLLDAVMTDSQP